MGLQKGPAERGHVKKRQKSSKSVKKFFDTFRQFSRRAKTVKNRQKVSKSFSTLFDNFRAAPFFRPLLQSADKIGWYACRCLRLANSRLKLADMPVLVSCSRLREWTPRMSFSLPWPHLRLLWHFWFTFEFSSCMHTLIRNCQSTVGGPKWTKMDLFRPKWTILVHLVSRLLNPVRDKVVLTIIVKMDHFGPFCFPTVLRPLPILNYLNLVTMDYHYDSPDHRQGPESPFSGKEGFGVQEPPSPSALRRAGKGSFRSKNPHFR